MRSKNIFRSLLGTVAVLSGFAVGAQAQTGGPTNAQLIDQILAKAKPGDKVVRSDDMLLSVAELRAYRARLGANRSAASAFFNVQLWNGAIGGKVPYVIDPSLIPAQRVFFLEACRELETVANLKFVPRTNEVDFIRVFTDPAITDFSYSAVGRVGGSQDLMLAGFGDRYTAVHEIMHALGLAHEQSRSDRDGFVTIDFTNIAPENQSQFAIINDSNNRGTYDFDSIMHYFDTAFALEPGKRTIIAKPEFAQFQSLMGQDDHISVKDKQGLVDLYGPSPTSRPPANDKFSKAEKIEGPTGTLSATNVFATEENGEDAATRNNATASIWYRWTPTDSGSVTINTKGSAIDTTLGVYTGTSVNTVTPIAFNDDEVMGASSPATGLTSSVTFPAQRGVTYYIAIDSFIDFQNNSVTGAVKLNWRQSVGASTLSLSGKVTLASAPTRGVAGVILTLSGATAANSNTSLTATTNASGDYSIARVPSGNYNLSASKIGFSFNPPSTSVTVNNNSTGNNFTATEIPAGSVPEMFVSDVSMREGKSGDSFLTFNIGLSAPARGNVTVNYATVNGSATSGSDYNVARGTITFAAGTTTMALNVRIRPDATVEANENFTLKLSAPVGAQLVDDTGLATILNDDVAGSPAASPSAPTAKIQKPTRLAMLDGKRN